MFNTAISVECSGLRMGVVAKGLRTSGLQLRYRAVAWSLKKAVNVDDGQAQFYPMLSHDCDPCANTTNRIYIASYLNCIP